MARRVRWCSFYAITLCVFFDVFWIQPTKADCFYDEEKYEEGVEVATFENCLNCTCTRGVLLCYLRVCPKLPNPPPVGCILLHRYRTCCPELICTDLGNENALEARSDPDGLDLLQFEGDGKSEACIANGSIYSPGSAMATSTMCEYCYCLRGRQTCVKPKCLLPIDGCIPSYDSNQCCPVQYNCSLPNVSSSTTTTIVPTTNLGGCFVDNEFYPEGGKVLGVGHSICDNCYCLRGMLRCEPLSCAPPLLGCTPIIKPGECCAASYNCTGSIEINPEPNYGQYPTVSKEYSKLRKEQPKYPSQNSHRRNGSDKPKDPIYVIAESLKSNTKSTSGTTRQFTGAYFNPSTTTPFYYKSMVKESDYNGYKHVTRSYHESKYGTTINHHRKPEMVIEARNSLTTIESETTTIDSTTYVENLDTTNFESTEVTTEETASNSEIDNATTEQLDSTTTEFTESITMKSVLNTTDCIDGAERRNDLVLNDLTTVTVEKINELSEINEFTPSVEVSSEDVPKADDITEVDLQSSFSLVGEVSPKVKNGSEIKSLLNASKTNENDYDFDYNEPSLPPSLPNLHIIPFLAADALDTKKEDNTIYAQDKSSNDSFEFNFFSPPVKTEGGFVPNNNPVILETLYDNAVTVPSITNSPSGTIEASCLSEGNKILHGQSVASDSPCTTCTCFYGNIVCQKAPCPIPGPKCRKSIEDLTLCCPLYVCDDESDHQKTNTDLKPATADPFKNVIKTEPAPDLQSLIVDMLPHLTRKPVKKTTIYITTLQPPEIVEKSTPKPDESLGFDGILALLLGGKETTDTTIPSSTSSTVGSVEQSTTNGAILKLAGCNIYGRMYRVGRIISELSGPCRECKCTEVGVQCKPLKC